MCSEDLDVCFVEVDIRCYESDVCNEGACVYGFTMWMRVFIEQGYVFSG